MLDGAMQGCTVQVPYLLNSLSTTKMARVVLYFLTPVVGERLFFRPRCFRVATPGMEAVPLTRAQDQPGRWGKCSFVHFTRILP